MSDLFGDVTTVDNGQRSALDFYETPGWMTRALLFWHRAICGATVLECCAGRDAITRELRDVDCTVYTRDIDPQHASHAHGDARTGAFWAGCPEVDWVITNPPFNVALPILKHAHAHARVGVAFLLRKTFLEPTTAYHESRSPYPRGEWLLSHPPTRIIGLPRYAFRGTGSDSVSCDWMLWEKERDPRLSPFVIDHLAESREP